MSAATLAEIKARCETRGQWGYATEDQTQDVVVLLAEVERLRAALQAIVSFAEGQPDDEIALTDMRITAEDALKDVQP